ncbi:hypothetical protein ERX35_006470 [Macrococcus equipercicus]|uniref:Uncharacterized protein n=1 Tax=Macrococcus equipercicus TaxID=69967 RepID=A0ABQ6R964_9STAP|nr:hypothetical protein [Macrococcus equipercicus]KAA1039716.1 hypothetical protein ERX35_006470 [Macrococcus equipercicus]
MTSFNKAFFIGLPLITMTILIIWFAIANNNDSILLKIIMSIIGYIGMRTFFKNLAHHLDNKQANH